MKTSAEAQRSLSQAVAIRELLQLADQCVKCGLCLPHCPTFQLARQEADSPRGRIALIQGWADGHLAMTPTLAGHLDGCLGCLNCERACPSEVAYGRIADQAKALRTAALPAPRRTFKRIALGALSSAWLMNRFARVPRLYRRLGLARLAERLGLDRIHALRPYHRMATAMGAVARPITPRNPEGADVDLFLGCMGSAAEGRAVAATLKVASRLNLGFRIVSPDTCCGAMLRHNGLPAQADAQRDACVRVHGERTLVGLASACVAELRGDPALRDTLELCAFLDGVEWPKALRLRPDRRRVLIHEPCSHRNQLGGNAAVHRLLGRIPGLAVAPLPPGQGCCGAAGTYLLRHPVMAEALLAELLAPVRLETPEVIVTTNPGCALHLAAGVREAGLDIAVMHPVELIAAALGPEA
ncbi:(Fe-S)-binding protein [Thiocapsa sp.]|uniref:(Fe-S)-binding protein n=1 Tax=Thiocapsa sp. TaxID=2024551 RepID=UPI002C09FF82|nr:(Fe-S)-binding protein [Thiocapsa sp.]HSO82027.1 (Fe-S)-binding protein [Thiocapsa sp.]